VEETGDKVAEAEALEDQAVTETVEAELLEATL
jgi:hypothetical protein